MSRRAFTLVEAIVVIILLGIIAGIAAPRLFRDDKRRADSAVASVAGVLGVIAQRETLGTVRMALTYNAQERVMRLERLALPTDDDGRLEALSRRDSGEWTTDPLAPRIALGSVRVEGVSVDGERIDSKDEWRIEFVPGEPRPLVEIDLAARVNRREYTWAVELLPYASEATHRTTSGSSVRRKTGLESNNLDALGQSEFPW